MADQRGFSMIEVLVAVAVFALAALALLGAQTAATRNLAEVEARTLAQLVAENRLTEAMLGPAPATGTTSGSETQGGRDWRWRITVAPTDLPDLLRIAVSVGPSSGPDDRALAERIAFRLAR